MTTAPAILDLSALNNQDFFGDIQYFTIDDLFALNVQHLPKDIYIRGEVDKSATNINEYKATLAQPSADGTFVRVIEPLVYFEMTQEEIAQSDLKGVILPNTRYWLNGNNRYAALQSFKNQKNKVAFALVPVQKVQVPLSRDLVLKLQQSYNDTTKKHSTFQTMLSIRNTFTQYIATGLTESEAGQKCEELFGVTAAYVSQAKKFDPEDETLEVVFNMIDSGVMAVDTAVTVIQTAQALNILPEVVINGILKDVGVTKRQVKISRRNVTTWRTEYEKLNGITPESKTAENASETSSETSGENNSEGGSSEGSEADESAPGTIDIEAARATINKAFESVQAVDLLINETEETEDEDQDLDNAEFFKSAAVQYSKILAMVLPKVPLESSKETYKRISRNAMAILTEINVMGLLDDSEKMKFASMFGKLAEKQLKPILKADELQQPSETEDVPVYTEDEEIEL